MSGGGELFEWNDGEESNATGWIFVDTVVNGCSSGSLEMTSDACKEETILRAKCASLLCAISTPQIGGAAVMIKFDKTDRMSGEILRRFLLAHISLLTNVLSLVGVTFKETIAMDRLVCSSLKLNGLQHAFSSHFARETGQIDLGRNVGPVLKRLSSSIPLTILAQGFGISKIVKCLQEILQLRPESCPRVVMIGFGSLGSTISYFLESQGIGQIVAIMDSDGWISDDDGLPIEDILEIRAISLQKRSFLGESVLEQNRTAGNLLCNLNQEQLLRFHAVRGSENLLCEAELVILTDESKLNSIGDMETFLGIVSRNKRHVFLPAIFPSSKEQVTLLESEDMCNVLRACQFSQVPYWVCLSGENQMLRSLAAIPFDFHLLDRTSSIRLVLDSISSPITSFLQEAYSTYSSKDMSDFGLACKKLAMYKLENPQPLAKVNFEETRLTHLKIYSNFETVAENISELLAQVKILFRALFRDHNDAILLAIVEDLITCFLLPHLWHNYFLQDTGERKLKRFALSLLQGVESFLKNCSIAMRESKVSVEQQQHSSSSELLDYLMQQRPKNLLDPMDAATAVLKHFGAPFTANTLILVIETLVSSKKLLVACESLLNGIAIKLEQEKVVGIKAVPTGSEKHKGEFGVAIGGIVSAICEMAEMSFASQLLLRVVLFFGGEYFLGQSFDQQLEPNVIEDIETIKIITEMVDACQFLQQGNGQELRIAATLAKIIPSVPMTSDAHLEISVVLTRILGDAELMRELVYYYIFPTLT